MRLLLCTDLDRTLLPNGDAVESVQARDRFRQLSEQAEITLVYVTGRHDELVKQAIEEFNVPVPDYVIADVGSTIYRVTENKWQVSSQWHSLLHADWQGMLAEDVYGFLQDIDVLELQEKQKQGEFKLSYYVSLDIDEQVIISKINDRLLKHKIQANLIYSVDEISNIGLLDILPSVASKLQAIQFLARELSIEENSVLFAGDSGNDYSVLVSSIPTVIVANASDELKHRVSQEMINKNITDRHYIARGDFMGMNGNYSAGIVEGIVHYFPYTREWIKA